MCKYKKEYCDELISHMKKGYSFEAYAAKISVNRSTLHRWRIKFPKFKDAYESGYVHSLLFWEKMGIGGTTGQIKNFNVAAWIFNMKNRFAWRDRIDHAVSGKEIIKISYENAGE